MKRTLAAVLIGAMPIAVLALATRYFLKTDGEPNKELLLGAAIGLGALWGFSAGIFRRSLLRSIIGLNVGALCAFTWFNSTEPLSDKSASFVVISLALTGGICGAAINFSKAGGLASLARGFLAGAVAFVVMSCATSLVLQYFTYDLLGWTVLCLVPFGGGMAIFLALLGREEQKPAAPQLNAPNAGALT
jgi:hypothetical protein